MSQTTDTNIISSINAVEGFDYEEGYEYEILVKGRMTPEPVIDRPAMLYPLIEIISKEKKNPDL